MNTYMKPTMMVVKIQHQTSILQASVTSISGGVLSLGGSDADYVEGGGGVRTKESSSIWDDEW